MEKLCKNCKHWDKKGTYGHVDHLIDLYLPDFSIIKDESEIRRLTGRLVRYCISPKLKFYERPGIDEAAVYDGSEYLAGIVTGENFGCVNFESNI